MHSKAPWKVITEESGTIWIAGHANGSSDDRYSEIAIIQTRGAASRDAHDNARLIAASPELLARLTLALNYLDHPDIRAIPFALPAEAIAALIRTAIANAMPTSRATTDDATERRIAQLERRHAALFDAEDWEHDLDVYAELIALRAQHQKGT
ncbi:MAG: hypothetical protein M3R61_00510 [Chloroflexota bacterium]|nr:hypothetical protein [Chloroflexota bacterium]